MTWWVPAARAWTFLTILPAPIFTTDQRVIGRTVALFPLIGVAIGLAVGGLGVLLDLVVSPGVVAALLVVAMIILTGGLHIDALADCADGLFGGWDAGRRLEIMRDSRVGAFGASAIALAVVLLWSSLAETSGFDRLAALVAAAASSRWSIVVGLALLRPARPDGLGATYAAQTSVGVLALSTLLVATCLGGLILLGAPIPLVLCAMFVALLWTGVMGWFASRRVGGTTGDTLGATALLAEITVLLIATGLAR